MSRRGAGPAGSGQHGTGQQGASQQGTSQQKKIAVVTGASAGIGAATAVRLAKEGFDVVLGARRLDRIEALAREHGGRALELDVTDRSSVEQFASAVERVDVLVNNAGKALGLEPVSELNDDDVRGM